MERRGAEGKLLLTAEHVAVELHGAGEQALGLTTLEADLAGGAEQRPHDYQGDPISSIPLQKKGC